MKKNRLMITRKKGEVIFIDEKTEISVREVQGGKVLISVLAPDCVKIRRGEKNPLAFKEESETSSTNGDRIT